MTQRALDNFSGSLEEAREWMQAVQERLQVNDNTQGPRDALEARLWQTEVCRGNGHDSPTHQGWSRLQGSVSQALMCLYLLGIWVEVQILIQEVGQAQDVAFLTFSR